jgi:hypothetical protein
MELTYYMVRLQNQLRQDRVLPQPVDPVKVAERRLITTGPNAGKFRKVRR